VANICVRFLNKQILDAYIGCIMPTSTISALNGPTGFAGDAQNKFHQPTTVRAALLALGIVYSDLGTSPLYTLQTIVHIMGDQFTVEAALGSLSLTFWSLIATISVKYCLFVMRADNHGEGGILALMTMTGAQRNGPNRGSAGASFGRLLRRSATESAYQPQHILPPRPWSVLNTFP
jgi:hypothetical protein